MVNGSNSYSGLTFSNRRNGCPLKCMETSLGAYCLMKAASPKNYIVDTFCRRQTYRPVVADWEEMQLSEIIRVVKWSCVTVIVGACYCPCVQTTKSTTGRVNFRSNSVSILAQHL